MTLSKPLNATPGTAPVTPGEHLLDRPIWSALTTRQAGLATLNGSARAFQADIARFVATDPEDRDARSSLARLVAARPGGLTLMQADPVERPEGLCTTVQALGVQMLLQDPSGLEPYPEATKLLERDVPEMLRLVDATQPGPFFQRTIAMGAYFGIRQNGCLVAMAGERMALTGFTEISAVCVDPALRGRGLARGLVAHVASRILDRGERPFLHAYADNNPAILLYRSMGFVVRTRMHIETLEAC